MDDNDMRHYVYTLAYPDGHVFYVGKGVGDRIHHHESEVRAGRTTNPYKENVIRRIWAEGGQVVKTKLAYFRTHEEAVEYERALIFHMDGLTNLTAGGDGQAGVTFSEEHRRKLAAHRKSLHGRLVHEIVHVGNNIRTEKITYRGWQKQFGRSVGLRAPGMLIDHLRRTVASTGGTLHEFSTRSTKLSQYCHGCGRYERKPLSQRWHTCPCGIGPVQRDLYAAFLATYLEAPDYRPSCARYEPYWEGAEARLRAAQERTLQRATEGQVLPRSMGMPRAGARLPKSPGEPTQELVFRRGRLEAWKDRSEPPVLQPGEPSAGLAGNNL